MSRLALAALILLLAVGSVSAAQLGKYTVPEASACVLAPMGIAAIIAIEKRRRRIAKICRNVGLAYYFVKRLVDISLASGILLLSSPLFMLIAIMVRLDSAGPIFFRRRVVGKNGKSFDMYKFRSMVDGAEKILEQDDDLKSEYYINCKLKEDPRITNLGKFLRKTSLDELPQLLNVLFGNMTFVGPRPIHHDEVDIYGPNVELFKTVTPGITGLWQTCGRSETSYEERVRMDMQYIEQRSILLDLWIIISTVPAVLLKRGAC